MAHWLRRIPVGGYLIAFVLVLPFTVVAGEKNVFSKTNSHSFKVRYDNNPVYRSLDINNNILEELARITLKDPFSVELGYTFNVVHNIDLSDLNNYVAGFSIRDLSCYGDISYKDFDLSPWLLPCFASFRAKIIWKENLEIASYDFRDVPLDESGCFNASFVFTDLNGGKNYTAEIDHVQMTFEPAVAENLICAIHNINGFYAANAILKEMLNEMDSFFKNSRFKKPGTFIAAFDMERILEHIEDQHFLYKLSIPERLEETFTGNLSAARYKLNSIMLHLPDFLKTHSRQPLIFSEPVADLYIRRVNSYFEHAQNIEYDSRDFFYRCGMMGYRCVFLKKISKQLLAERPFQKRNLTASFFNNVFKGYLTKAQYYIENQNFKTASDLLKNATGLYDLSGKQGYPVALNTMRSRSDYGIYNSYLTIAERAIQAGNYNMAETYVRRADEFQKSNAITIISGEEVKRSYENLIDLFIQKAEVFMQNEKYGDALFCFNKTEELSLTISRFNFDYAIEHGILEAKNGYYCDLLNTASGLMKSNDPYMAEYYFLQAKNYREQNKTVIRTVALEKEIENSLAQKKFYDLYSNGIQLLGEKNYLTSHEYLYEAWRMKEQYEWPGAPAVIPHLNETAKYAILKQIEKGQAAIISDSVTLAEEHLHTALKLIAEFGLVESPELNDATDNLKNKIEAKKCQQKQLIIEKLIHEARVASLNIRYAESMDILNKALEISAKCVSCDFSESDSIVHASVNSIMPAALYQMSCEEAAHTLETNDFTGFAHALKRILMIYDELTNRGHIIEKAPLSALISDPYFENKLRISLDHFFTENNFAGCLDILKIFSKNGYPPREFAGFQEKLAACMAKNDLLTGPPVNPEHKLMEHTGNSEWFRPFNKTYLGAF
ncbi:MAG: hypothetical protein JXA03_03825 [Bacteroidales bacterium]|nr:hypothetical protein [Bacteroidales bacterium]